MPNKPNKVLFCATVDTHFEKFHLPYFRWFREQGWEVHVAAAGTLDLPHVDRRYVVPFARSPFRPENVRAYRELAGLIEGNGYALVHCHTPVGGALARLAARRARRRGTHVLYTAHGFHFFRGSSLLSWLTYYPMERWLSRYTDCLITINEEDYAVAAGRSFPAGRVERVHGVGVDLAAFQPPSEARKRELKERLGYRDSEFLLFYAAEFNRNKNQQLLLRALALLQPSHPSARLLLAGDGPLLAECRELADRLGVGEKVRFLGYRRDVDAIVPACDLAVASSYREGLPVNVMEAMACGLPVVATDNRGHRELVQPNLNGWIVPADDPRRLAEAVASLIENEVQRRRMGAVGAVLVRERYSLESVLSEQVRIYSAYMEEEDRVQWATL